MKKIIITSFVLGAVLVSCAPKASTSKANEIMPTVASTAMADIQAGQTIYTTKCTKCHGVKDTYLTKHSYEEAKPVMAAMSQKAKLTKAETAQLAAYVFANAKK